MTEDPKTELLVQIHDLIDETFNLAEFRDLCFRLGVKYDNLRGETLSERIHDLVQLMYRRRRLDDLLNFCARLRPETEWPDLSDPVALNTGSEAITPQTRNPDQIFISHARQDADFAHKLADDLRFHGWEVWIAPDSIQPGEKWVDAINRGLTESGVFLLALTPDAVSSTWVHSETNVAISLQHQNSIRFIPLDVKPAKAPPLWQAYQWIPFQSDYKSALERLLQELQPEKMAQVAGLYRQMQDAVGRREWALVQKLGAEINELYPDYRETEMQIALAQQEEIREKGLQAEADKLYKRVQSAFDANDWATVLLLTRQVEAVIPNYRDVNQLAARAHRNQRQGQRDAISKYLHFIPVWGWGGGIVVGVLALFFFFQLFGGDDGHPSATPTRTVSSVSQLTPETLTATETPEPTEIITLSNTPTPEPTDTQQPTNRLTSTSTSTPIMTLTTTPSLTPTLGIGSTWIREKDGAVMVYVPAGEFTMGSDDGRDNEKPLHTVYLDSYWLDQTEITNGRYALCVQDEICDQPLVFSSYTHNNYYPNPSYTNYPVIYVSWADAQTYCEWTGSRLPTEAEWEKAARWDEEAKEARTYPWEGQINCDHANYNNCVGDTTAVATYLDGISPYGAYDMSGNVWEWVADWYDGDYYAELVYDNPIGSPTGDYRVLRGGSWGNDDNYTRAAFRYYYYNTSNRLNLVGFRCAQD